MMSSLMPQEPVAVPRNEASNLITEMYSNSPIQFDIVNGRLMANATMMCQAFKEKPDNWLRNKSTQRYLLDALKSDSQICASLFDVRKGNSGNFEQGTWIDERLILPLAQWLDPNFYIWCNDKIAELLRTSTTSIQKKLIAVCWYNSVFRLMESPVTFKYL